MLAKHGRKGTRQNIRHYNYLQMTYLRNPKHSIPNFVRLIENFGSFSGYKINNSKSILLLLNKEERHNPTSDTPYMKTEGFRYLGVKITPKLNKITLANYNPLEKVTESLKHTSTLPISMIGQTNFIKIPLTTNFLYYFHHSHCHYQRCFITNLTNLLVNSFGMIGGPVLTYCICLMSKEDYSFLISDGIIGLLN